jgi:hypothetical protein
MGTYPLLHLPELTAAGTDGIGAGRFFQLNTVAPRPQLNGKVRHPLAGVTRPLRYR